MANWKRSDLLNLLLAARFVQSVENFHDGFSKPGALDHGSSTYRQVRFLESGRSFI
jgi:hypothetical protein